MSLSPPMNAYEPGLETLDRVRNGQRVRIVEIEGASPEQPAADSDSSAAILRRLDDLGLRAGVEIEVLRRAPLGDPTVFELHGYQLCLRRSESVRVRVEAISSGKSAGRDAAGGRGR